MMQEKPVVTVVHELSGRLRIRLSHSPQNDKKMIKAVQDHEGIDSITFTPVTKSLLVLFDPGKVSREELLIRIGLYLALDYGTEGVYLYSQPLYQEMSDSAFYSGLSLAVALLGRFFSRSAKGTSLTEWMAGGGTALAVLEHGWSEVKQHGNFDPEVLSVVYLLIAMIRGNFLPAAIFTWISAFGRHLIKIPSKGVELRPVLTSDGTQNDKEYEVEISTIQDPDDKMLFFGMVPALLKFAFTGEGHMTGKNLIHQMQRVSELHGKVLEGLGKFRDGIPLKINMA